MSKAIKKQFTTRINVFLFDKMEEYIDVQNKKGISTKKVDVIEKALYDFLKEKGLIDEK